MMNLVKRLRGLRGDECGQVLPLAAFCMIGLLGMCAVGLDIGRALYSYRELQATTDSAALAGARLLTSPTTQSSDVIGSGATVSSWSAGGGNAVAQYSAVTGGMNVRPSLPAVTVVGALKCLSTLQSQGQPCVGTVPYNAVQVTQTTTVPMYFAGLFGHSTWPLITRSTAAARGGSARPSNIVVIQDMTLSSLSTDTDCGNTELQCQLNGMQVLLNSLMPCSQSQAACASGGVIQNPFDQVALFTFPAVAANTAYIDTNCTSAVPAPTAQNGYYYDAAIPANIVMPQSPTGQNVPPYSGIPTGMSYPFPTPGAGTYSVTGTNATYQITPFLADYKLSDAATTLDGSSILVKAAGYGAPGCPGMAPTNYDGVVGTYYAGVLYAAQSALVQQHATNPNAENVIILLSDGNATTPQSNWGWTIFPVTSNSGMYPSYVGECGQAVVAAQAATRAGTLVYSVAYGSAPIGCASDAGAGSYPNISPCDTMASIASAPQFFYSDWKQSGSGSTCVSSQPVTSLNTIFQAIANDLTFPRLIPNTTT